MCAAAESKEVHPLGLTTWKSLVTLAKAGLGVWQGQSQNEVMAESTVDEKYRQG